MVVMHSESLHDLIALSLSFSISLPLDLDTATGRRPTDRSISDYSVSGTQRPRY